MFRNYNRRVAMSWIMQYTDNLHGEIELIKGK